MTLFQGACVAWIGIHNCLRCRPHTAAACATQAAPVIRCRRGISVCMYNPRDFDWITLIRIDSSAGDADPFCPAEDAAGHSEPLTAHAANIFTCSALEQYLNSYTSFLRAIRGRFRKSDSILALYNRTALSQVRSTSTWVDPQQKPSLWK